MKSIITISPGNTVYRPYKLIHKLLLFFSFLIFHDAAAQSTLGDRITRVENSLTENIQFSGSKPMNLQERMKHYKVNGLSIAVIKDYKIDFVKAYGLADTELKIPVSDKTLFQAASISKSLNGLALMKL
jgi:CubicO group peptidase (beta-lactamase class C family)